MQVPTTIEEAAELRAWALALPAAPATSASTDQLGRHLEFMAAALPSRANDAETGKKRFAVYASILAGWSNEALAFMARRACETLEWFPSPKHCLDILADYRPPPTTQAVALLTSERVAHRLFDDWLRDLRAGADIGEVPEHWKRIAVEQGDVRRLSDGSYVSRLLYHGPPCPPRRPTSREMQTGCLPLRGASTSRAGQAGASAGVLA